MKLESVALIGMGGIGSNLYNPLQRLIGSGQLYIIDGDRYETKNSSRQTCGRHTMSVSKVKASMGCKEKGVIRIQKYVDKPLMGKLLKVMKRPAVLIVAVDNNATRKLTLEALDADDRGPLFWISPANGLDNSQISVYHRNTSLSPLPHPFDRYQNIRHPSDLLPSNGCSQQTKEFPQLLRTNLVTASLTLSLIHDIQHDRPLPAELNYSLLDYTGQQLRA